jgi:alpha-N-arabinofuranosidase
VPLLRWPGGCYAEHYHWRDGIGPADRRPRRLGLSCGLQVEDDNGLGTHEFIQLCRMIGAQPYLAGNLGNGTPQELCDWVEYCNSSFDTTLTRERAANGSPQPFGVKLWGVGNENWGCGGNFDAETYAKEYRRFATMLRHTDPSAELVIAGTGDVSYRGDVWNIGVLRTLGRHIDLADHLSIHHYWVHGGPESDFTEANYYTLLAEAATTEGFIKHTAAIIADEAGGRRIGIALDEWGVWHPEARPWGPGEVERRVPITYEQANTLRDALAAGIALEGFHRQCNVLAMANLAQIVNILQATVMTDDTSVWLTPTYHALNLHTPHVGAAALPVEMALNESLPDGSGAVSATASRSDEGITITLINRHFSQPASVHITGTGTHRQLSGRLLAADSPNAANSSAKPDHITPVSLTAYADGGDAWRVELPPHSMATIQLQ